MSRWRIVAAVVAVAALFAAMRLLPVDEWLRALQQRVDGMGAAGALLYGAIYVVGVLLFVPGSVLTIGAGLLFGLLWGSVVVSIAATLASALAFLIARHVMRGQMERLSKSNKRFAAIDAAIREKGWKVVALLRLSPLVPYSLSNYLYGLTSVSFWPYVLASWAGMLPGTVLYVYLGAAGKAATGDKSFGEWALLGAGLVATAAVTIMLTRTARRQLKQARG